MLQVALTRRFVVSTTPTTKTLGYGSKYSGYHQQYFMVYCDENDCIHVDKCFNHYEWECSDFVASRIQKLMLATRQGWLASTHQLFSATPVGLARKLLARFTIGYLHNLQTNTHTRWSEYSSRYVPSSLDAYTLSKHCWLHLPYLYWYINVLMYLDVHVYHFCCLVWVDKRWRYKTTNTVPGNNTVPCYMYVCTNQML